MAIDVGQVITYSDLVDLVLTSIKNRCQNIDKLNNIPSTLNGESKTINGSVTTTYTDNNYHGRGTDKRVALSGAISSVATVEGTNPITVVAFDTVKNELNSFLSNRGIALPKETVMTQRGILNFFVNVASFVKTKVVTVGNDLTSETAVVYVSTNKDIPNFPTINSNLGNVNQTELSDRKSVV